MGINVNSLSPTEAKKYWYDYNNGNVKGLSEAEYQSICTKFRSYLDNWESETDENGYNYTETPEERLDYDADDAGLGLNVQTAQATTSTSVAVGATAGVSALTTGAASMSSFGTMAGEAAALTEAYGAGSEIAKMASNTAKKAAVKNSASLLVAATLQFATMIWYKTNTPNKDAVEACQTAQDELYTEQANLADQVLTMEEMQEEMELLQEQAIQTNEQGQDEITDLEGLYNYYYTKVQNGTATDKEKALLQALSAQMAVTQSETNSETTDINEDIVAVGDGYEDITAKIDNTNQFTNYVSEIDKPTQTAAIAQGAVLALSAASAAFTCSQALMRATTLTASVFGAAAAVMYYAAAAMSGVAAAFFGMESYNQLTNFRATAEDTIDIRESTQDLSTETTEFQEVSTAFWEESVDVTSEDNLFTLTPTYSNAVPTTNSNSGEQAVEGAESTAANTSEPQTGTNATDESNTNNPFNPFIKDEDE